MPLLSGAYRGPRIARRSLVLGIGLGMLTGCGSQDDAVADPVGRLTGPSALVPGVRLETSQIALPEPSVTECFIVSDRAVVGDERGAVTGFELATKKVSWSHPTARALAGAWPQGARVRLKAVADGPGPVALVSVLHHEEEQEHLVALDLETGRPRWRWVGGTKQEGTFAVSGNRAGIVLQRVHLGRPALVGIDPANGSQRWRRPDARLFAQAADGTVLATVATGREVTRLLRADTGTEVDVTPTGALTSALTWESTAANFATLRASALEGSDTLLDLDKGTVVATPKGRLGTVGLDRDGRALTVWSNGTNAFSSWKEGETALTESRPSSSTSDPIGLVVAVIDGIVWTTANATHSSTPRDRVGRAIGRRLDAPILKVTKDWLIEARTNDRPTITVHRITRG